MEYGRIIPLLLTSYSVLPDSSTEVFKTKASQGLGFLTGSQSDLQMPLGVFCLVT